MGAMRRRMEIAEVEARRQARLHSTDGDVIQRLWLMRAALTEPETVQLAVLMADPPPGLKLYEGVNLMDVV